MKKTLLGMFACLMLWGLTTPMQAEASEPGVYLGTQSMTVGTKYINNSGTIQEDAAATDNYAVLTGDASGGYTLTLDDFSYSGNGYNYSGSNWSALYSTVDLTLTLSGDNSFTLVPSDTATSLYIIRAYQKSLLINGGGTLTVTNTTDATERYQRGIQASEDLTFDGVTVNVSIPDGLSSEAVVASQSLTIKDSNLTATAGAASTSDSYGINLLASGNTTTITDSVVTATASTAGGYSYGINTDALTINSSEITSVTASGDRKAFSGTVTLGTGMAAKAGADSANATISNVADANYYEQKYVYIVKGAQVFYVSNLTGAGTPPTDSNYYLMGVAYTPVAATPTAPSTHSFLGWSSNPSATTADASFTVYAHPTSTFYGVWQPNSFSATLDNTYLSGSVTASLNKTSVPAGDSVILTLTPTDPNGCISTMPTVNATNGTVGEVIFVNPQKYTCTISNITADTTIAVTAAADSTTSMPYSYSATVDQSGLSGATVTLSKDTTIFPTNDPVTISITPNSGFAFSAAPTVTASEGNVSIVSADGSGGYVCYLVGIHSDTTVTVTGTATAAQAGGIGSATSDDSDDSEEDEAPVATAAPVAPAASKDSVPKTGETASAWPLFGLLAVIGGLGYAFCEQKKRNSKG